MIMLMRKIRNIVNIDDNNYHYHHHHHDGDDDIGDIDEIKVFGRGPRGVKCVSDILTQVDCPRNRFLVKMLMTSAIMIVLMMMMTNVVLGMKDDNRKMQIK